MMQSISPPSGSYRLPPPPATPTSTLYSTVAAGENALCFFDGVQPKEKLINVVVSSLKGVKYWLIKT